MSSNEYLTDVASRHAVLIQRYSAGVGKQAGRRIESIINKLVEYVDDPSFRLIAYELYSELEEELLEEIISFVESEGEFSVQMLSKAVSAPVVPVPTSILSSAALTLPIDVTPGRSMTVRQALSQFSAAKVRQVEQLIRDGAGETSQQLVNRLIGIIPLQKTQAGALVRTANNAASTIAAFKTFEQNADIFDGYKWVSTLDSRTSFICMGRDGSVYPFLESSPRPPAHWGCRSVVIPKVKRQFDLGADLDGGRPSETGEVSAKVKYGGWLRKQPRKFIDEALGEERASLFLSGKVPIDGFADPTGRVYTLEELRNTTGLVL